VRIVAGRFGGRRLTAPKGRSTRPTADKVREALFDLLGPLEGAAVADLFAGSGALGLEALSRGASSLVAVDRAEEALRAVKTNLKNLGLGTGGGEPLVTVLKRDLGRGLGFLGPMSPFDLILADPPYGRGWPERLLVRLPAGFLAPGGRLILETSTQESLEPSPPWRLIQDRGYGQTRLLILTLTPEAT
jgi:16S rRNA (guanine966-N2)-methyltransferase